MGKLSRFCGEVLEYGTLEAQVETIRFCAWVGNLYARVWGGHLLESVSIHDLSGGWEP